jgi:hypothetical protein
MPVKLLTPISAVLRLKCLSAGDFPVASHISQGYPHELAPTKGQGDCG